MHLNRDHQSKTTARERIRILLSEMTPMLLDIISQTIATQPDLCVAGKVRRNENLLEAMKRTNADVLIAGNSAAGREQYDELLRQRPRLKVLEIAGNDGQGLLYEMHPRHVSLGQMSPVSLLDVIRASASPTSTSGAQPR